MSARSRGAELNTAASRGRSGGRGRGGAGRGGPLLPPKREIMDDLETLALGTLHRRTLRFVQGAGGTGHEDLPEFQVADCADVEVDDLRYVGSYCWTDQDHPTILVPGYPRIWHEPEFPFTVQDDRDLLPGGFLYKDQNGHRIPSCPLLPIFVAIDAVQPTPALGWHTLDYVMDRNCMRKLLLWMEPKKSDDFRIDAELVGQRTVLFHKWEPRAAFLTQPNTFGAGFATHTTTLAADCQASTGYFRIVHYDFNGLSLVVRHGIEACTTEPTTTTTAGSPAHHGVENDNPTAAAASPQVGSAGHDAVAETLAGLSLAGPLVRIIKAGAPPPSTGLLELNTRSASTASNFSTSEWLPQLMLSQTSASVLGIHKQGTFTRLRRIALDDPDRDAAKAQAQVGLKKLRRVLEEIQDFMLGDALGKKVSFVCKDGVLRAHERTTENGMLPEEFVGRFST